MILGNKYVLYFSLEAAILLGIFSKMPNKIAASKENKTYCLLSARKHLYKYLIDIFQICNLIFLGDIFIRKSLQAELAGQHLTLLPITIPQNAKTK